MQICGKRTGDQGLMHQETNHQASKGHQGRYYCTTVLPYFCEVTTIPMPKPCNHRHRSSEGPSCFELDESFPTRRHSQQSVKYCVSEPDPRDPIVDPDDRPISDLRSIFLEERARLELSFFFFSSHQAFAEFFFQSSGVRLHWLEPLWHQYPTDCNKRGTDRKLRTSTTQSTHQFVYI